MSSDDKNQNLFNQLVTSFSGSAGLYDYGRFATIAGAALAGGALYYYLNSNKPQPLKLIDYQNQTHEAANRTDGARLCNWVKDDKIQAYYWDDVKTLYDLFKKRCSMTGDNEFLGWKPASDKPYQWLSYNESGRIAQQIGSAFVQLGLEPGKEAYVGIFAKNRVEWTLTSLACDHYSLVSVPLYDTLGDEAISFILVQTQLKLVVCDDSAKAMQLMSTKSNLEHVIVIDKINDEVRQKAAEMNIRVHSFDEVKQLGKDNLIDPVPPKTDDLNTICYTSGTTGTPKGAMITHRNMISIVSHMLSLLHKTQRIQDGKERYVSYLPLAHMFERAAQSTMIGLGACIGFYQGDIKKLVDDIKEVRPTIFCTVPRLLNRIYAKIVENLDKSSNLKKAIFKWAFANKEREIKAGIVRNNSIYDFAFKQIRESLGGLCKFMLTGSAPISPEILHFLRIVCGCVVIEGYGATETGGACSIQIPGETSVGSIGPPFTCCMYKLVDVPEMNLVVSRDNRGEICIFGHNVFKGYYKDEEKTKAALDSDGWYHTGDIGMYDSAGCIRIVDRVKNIFKLQQGEYIAPEKIENIYVRSKYVAQAFVYGNSYKSSLVAVLVPEESVVMELAKQNGWEESSLKNLCNKAELKKHILDDLIKLGKAGGLKGFEQVKDFYLHHELFSIENGLLTPTMKSKRNEIQKYFQAQIDQIYQNLE